MPLVDLFTLYLYHIKRELSRMKRVLCSIFEMNPLSKRCHFTVRPDFLGEGPHTVSLFPGWDSMTHVDSQGLGLRFAQKRKRVWTMRPWDVRVSRNFLSREYGFHVCQGSREKLEEAFLIGRLSYFDTHSLIVYLFLDVCLFSTRRAEADGHWAISCNYLYPLRLPSA